MKTEFLKKRSLTFKEILVAEVEIGQYIFHLDVKEISDYQEEMHPQEMFYVENSDMCTVFWSLKNINDGQETKVTEDRAFNDNLGA